MSRKSWKSRAASDKALTFAVILRRMLGPAQSLALAHKATAAASDIAKALEELTDTEKSFEEVRATAKTLSGAAAAAARVARSPS